MKKLIFRLFAASITLAAFASQALAEPLFARQYRAEYGYTPSCNACHKDGGGSPVNDYGKAFEEADMNAAAFAAIGELDSDGDGFANAAEAKAQANPGDAGSTPKDKGNWLDTSSLIPKPVQQAFPEVKTYKPLDAIFTDAEVARAKKLGVNLTEDDQNTIYIPVQDGKAVGTAIIAPVVYDKQQFFLLVVTGPKLTITKVAPVTTKNLGAAEDAEIYRRFAGMPADGIDLEAKPGSLDAAIVGGVRKAGAIVTVRLKK